MKNTLRTLFWLLLSIICSCTSDEQFQEVDKVETKVTAVLPDWNLEEEGSRTSITTGSYPTNPNPVWVTGDSIGIYPDAGGDQLSFRINQGGSKTCTFDGGGWAMKSSSYTAYSPFKRSFYYEEKDKLPISMLGQSQKGNDNADHLGAYDIQIAKGDKPENGSLIFQFNRYVALARLEISAPKAAKWTSVTLESDALFTTEAKMNLTLETPTVTPVKTSNSVTLKLVDVTTTNENPSIIAYMMFLPVDLTGKSLSVKLTDSEDNTYSCNATVTNNKTNFAANAARWISAEFEVETIPNNQIWYTSSDGNVITPYATNVFGANMVSNVYENGRGIITFNKNVTALGENAFTICTSLTNITIPNSVTSIGNYAFSGCTSLASIIIPNSVITIGERGFYHCTSLTNITIPNSVSEIGETAFYGCSSLTNITISDGVKNIKTDAFGYCTALTSITIPNSITSIEPGVFKGCALLSNITVEEGNSVYDSRENCNAIIETTSNTLISGCKNTIIPNSVTTIGKSAFLACSSLTDITIPNSVTSIEYYAFGHCTSLTEITIPSSVSKIGDSAFWECNSLSKVNVMSETPPTVLFNSFKYCSSNLIIYVPSGCINTYKSAGWTHWTLSTK